MFEKFKKATILLEDEKGEISKIVVPKIISSDFDSVYKPAQDTDPKRISPMALEKIVITFNPVRDENGQYYYITEEAD